jgi:ABC-type lipoprotein export system ATPase subunit
MEAMAEMEAIKSAAQKRMAYESMLMAMRVADPVQELVVNEQIDLMNEEITLRNEIMTNCDTLINNALSSFRDFVYGKVKERELAIQEIVRENTISEQNALRAQNENVRICTQITVLTQKKKEAEERLPKLLAVVDKKVGLKTLCPKCAETVYIVGSTLILDGIEECEEVRGTRSKIEAYKQILAAVIPELVVVPQVVKKEVPTAIRYQNLQFVPSKSYATTRTRTAELKRLISMNCPIPNNDSLARASLAAFDSLARYDEHVAVHGLLDFSYDADRATQLYRNYTSLKAKYDTAKDMRTKLLERVNILERTLGPEPQVETQLSGASEVLTKIIYLVSSLSEYETAIAEYNIVKTKETEQLNSLNLLLFTLDYVIKQRTRFVEIALNEISATVNEILVYLFDGRAHYALHANEKEQIDTVIEHDSRNDLDLNSLSGGEVDRFSIAIAAAFARFRGSPVLFYDETLSSLDPARRIDCLNIISQVSRGRVVILILHDPPEGSENVLNIKDLAQFA